MASSQVRREFWERVVNDQLNSGQNGRAWCQANGVAVASFYIWRRKLSASSPSGAAAGPRSSDIQWLGLEQAMSTSSSPSGLTLRVGAISVDIATGFDTRALSDVLTILESRC